GRAGRRETRFRAAAPPDDLGAGAATGRRPPETTRSGGRRTADSEERAPLPSRTLGGTGPSASARRRSQTSSSGLVVFGAPRRTRLRSKDYPDASRRSRGRDPAGRSEGANRLPFSSHAPR